MHERKEKPPGGIRNPHKSRSKSEVRRVEKNESLVCFYFTTKRSENSTQRKNKLAQFQAYQLPPARTLSYSKPPKPKSPSGSGERKKVKIPLPFARVGFVTLLRDHKAEKK